MRRAGRILGVAATILLAGGCDMPSTKAGLPAVAAPAGAASDGATGQVNLQTLARLAEQGDVKASRQVALAYELGEGVVENQAKAAHYLQLAANGGDAEALRLLAERYRVGRGVPTHYGKALALAQKALYAPGPATGQGNLPELVRLAEQGDVKASRQVALAFELGEGVVEDQTEAAHYLQLAANGGDAEAMRQLAERYRAGRGVQTHYGKALALGQQALQAGAGDAAIPVAIIYRDGLGVKKNPEAATAALASGGEKGSLWALNVLASRLWSGQDVPQDEARAVALWRRAIDMGCISCFDNLAEAYRDGRGVNADPEAAVRWWEKGIAAGDQVSTEGLAKAYRDGKVIPRNDHKAFELFLRAAANGSARSQLEVAGAYMAGKGVERDNVLAHAWANLSATNPEFASNRYKIDGKFIDSYATDREQALRIRGMSERRIAQDELTEAHAIASSWSVGDRLARKASNSNHGQKTTGTAFYISAEGHAITNAHVANGCQTLAARGSNAPIKVVLQDQANDLALLKIDRVQTTHARLRADPSEVRQGEDVFVFGYPLSAVLSTGGNLTPGLVSALTGVDNNSSRMQITAPVQPGSSGSPVMDRKGRVVGVVSAKLSDVKLAQATGQVGQSVNFAVNAQTLILFLRNAGVPFEGGASWFTFDKSPADLADYAKQWTVSIECQR